jgi:hypothetical protein
MLSAALDDLAHECRGQGLAAAVDRYDEMRVQTRRFRFASDVLESLIPLRRLASELLYYSDVVEHHGLGPGSRQALERWKLFPRVEMHGAARSALKSRPFLAFGNHPAGVEVAFFNALLDRGDVFFLGGTHVQQILPGLAPWVIAVERRALVNDSPPTRLRQRVVASASGRLWASAEHVDVAARNREAVEQVVRLIGHERAGVHMFPAGSMDVDASWRHGIGRIVGELRHMSPEVASSVLLVPIVYRVGPSHVMGSNLLPVTSSLRRLAKFQRWAWTGSPSVFVPRPVLLAELKVEGAASPETLTAALHDLWWAAAAESHTAMRPWFSAWRHERRRAGARD